MVFKAIQRNGYDDTLMNGPKSSWLGYSLLPEGQHQKNWKFFRNPTFLQFQCKNVKFELVKNFEQIGPSRPWHGAA